MQINIGTNNIYQPDYELERTRCSDFISKFEDLSMKEDPLHGKKKYLCYL